MNPIKINLWHFYMQTMKLKRDKYKQHSHSQKIKYRGMSLTRDERYTKPINHPIKRKKYIRKWKYNLYSDQKDYYYQNDPPSQSTEKIQYSTY